MSHLNNRAMFHNAAGRDPVLNLSVNVPNLDLKSSVSSACLFLTIMIVNPIGIPTESTMTESEVIDATVSPDS